MASYADLKKYAEKINDGILEVISSYGLTSDLVEGSRTSFVPNLMSLMQKEWSWAMHNPDLLSEMLAEVYIRVFVTRANSVFKSYIPKGKEGHEAPLENFLHFIMGRAYQEISKLKYGQMKRFKEINPMDGQSLDDAVDHLMQNTKVKTTQEYSNRMEDLNELIGYYEDRLKNLIKDDPHNTTRLNSFKKRLDSLEEELNLLEKESVFDKTKKYDNDEIEHPMSHDDKMFYDRLITDLKKIIKQTEENPDSQLQVFKMLADDYSPSEIARAMDVSTAKISQRIAKLKEAVKRLAHHYKEDGDSDLYNSLQRLMSNGGKRTANRMQVGV